MTNLLFKHPLDEETVWEWIANTFEYGGNSNGPITAERLRYNVGDIITFEGTIEGTIAREGIIEDIIVGSNLFNFKKRLQVEVGTPLPRPSADWLYGDTHYHSEFTRNTYEWGGCLNTVAQSIRAMDIDWVTITDHASNQLDWDLNASQWSALRTRINTINASTGLPFILGEEITAIPGNNSDEGGIHLLVYNNNYFIDGTVTITNRPTRPIAEVLNDVWTQAGRAFAAHPMNCEQQSFLGDIVPWKVPSPSGTNSSCDSLPAYDTYPTAIYIYCTS